MRLIGELTFALTAALAACGSDEMKTEPKDDPSDTSAMTITVSENLTADATWTKQNTYVLRRHVFVEAGTLTIEAGTRILGDEGSSLVITQNARLAARGTAEAPILFTSSKAVGQRGPGDWGGLVLLGKAPINVTGGTEKIEGFPASEALTLYGGSAADHDCGALTYARIEFAGFEYAQDNELNGLTLGGCGSRTTIDFVQVHKGADDGVEIFGGTVNLKHVVVTQVEDDGLDWDFGWRGKLQYLVIQQFASKGNMAIEADNNKDANDATPRSSPEIWNATLIGSDAMPGMAGDKQFGLHLRRGTAGKLRNFIITHFADFPIDIDGGATRAQAESGALTVEASIFFDNANLDSWPSEAMDNDDGFDEGQFFSEAAHDNRFLDPKITDMLNLSTPDMKPMVGSPVRNGGATPPDDGFFAPTATFIGAVGDTDWMKSWTAFPNN